MERAAFKTKLDAVGMLSELENLFSKPTKLCSKLAQSSRLFSKSSLNRISYFQNKALTRKVASKTSLKRLTYIEKPSIKTILRRLKSNNNNNDTDLS